MIFDPRWLPLLLAEIYNGKNKNQLNFSMKFRSQIENKVSDYRVLRASSFLSDQCHSQEIEKEKVQELTDICSESNRNTAETATTIDLADVDHNPNDLSGAEIDRPYNSLQMKCDVISERNSPKKNISSDSLTSDVTQHEPPKTNTTTKTLMTSTQTESPKMTAHVSPNKDMTPDLLPSNNAGSLRSKKGQRSSLKSFLEVEGNDGRTFPSKKRKFESIENKALLLLKLRSDNSSSNITKSSADISGLTSVTSSNSDTKESFMRSHQESEISGHTSVSRSNSNTEESCMMSHQESEIVPNQVPSARLRTRRNPKPKKLHKMECYLKLDKVDPYKSNDLMQFTVTEDQNVKRSHTTKCNIHSTSDEIVFNQAVSEEVKVSPLSGVKDTLEFEDNESETFPDDKPFVPFEVYAGSDDDWEEGSRVSSKVKSSSSVSILDKNYVMANYLNNVRSRIKRNRKRVGASIKCPTCKLAFYTTKGYKRHKVACQMIKCPRCKASYRTLGELEKHIETHNNDTLYQCRYCDMKFITLNNRNRHETRKHGCKPTKTYSRCPLCPKKFLTTVFLRGHLKDSHDEHRHICLHCNKFFDTEFDYNQHKDEHNKKKSITPYVCKKCGKSYETLHYLKRHNRMIHKARNERICKLCLEYFEIEKYEEHLKTHEWDKPNMCSFCRESFPTKELLEQHVRNVHHQGINYICEICGFEASHYPNMKHHRLEHADKMPHTCEVCGKGFALKTKLKDHMVGHSDDLPFVCETCGKRFKRMTTLRSHRIVHGAGLKCRFCERVFRSVGGLEYHIVRCHANLVNIDNYRKTLLKCEECQIFFPSANSYKQHLIRHSTQKAWECSKCDKCFKTELQKQKHEKSHQEQKPFFCGACKKGFVDKVRWNKHLITDKHKTNIAMSECQLSFERNRKKEKNGREKKKEMPSEQERVIGGNPSVSTEGKNA